MAVSPNPPPPPPPLPAGDVQAPATLFYRRKRSVRSCFIPATVTRISSSPGSTHRCCDRAVGSLHLRGERLTQVQREQLKEAWLQYRGDAAPVCPVTARRRRGRDRERERERRREMDVVMDVVAVPLCPHQERCRRRGLVCACFIVP